MKTITLTEQQLKEVLQAVSDRIYMLEHDEAADTPADQGELAVKVQFLRNTIQQLRRAK